MPSDLNAAIELHDSAVEAISHEGGWLIVQLSPACLHKSVGRPGVNDGFCMIQDARLLFRNGRIEGLIGNLPAGVLDGDVQIGRRAVHNMIALPCSVADQAVLLTLFLEPDYRRLLISGTGLEIALEGSPDCVAEVRWGNRSRTEE